MKQKTNEFDREMYWRRQIEIAQRQLAYAQKMLGEIATQPEVYVPQPRDLWDDSWMV